MLYLAECFITALEVSIDTNFHIDIGDGHIDIESFTGLDKI